MDCIVHGVTKSRTGLSDPRFRLSYRVKVKVKSLSRVQLFATPWTVAYQAPLSMGFSRQEYWSGLPFPSESMKMKRESEVTQLCLTLRDPMNCSPPGSSVHGIFQPRVLEWGAIAFSVKPISGSIFSL